MVALKIIILEMFYLRKSIDEIEILNVFVHPIEMYCTVYGFKNKYSVNSVAHLMIWVLLNQIEQQD